MKRNIVKHGPSTLTISLPASWVKKNNLKPGTLLDVEEKGEKLIINTKKQDEFISLNVDLKNNYKTGLRYLNASYRKGCDEIILNYEDPDYLKKLEKCLAEEVLGFEIVKQGKNFCVIKDIPGTKDEFDILLERIWTILISISEDVLKALEENDKSMFNNIFAIEKRINKFTNFCIRILNKKGIQKYKNIPIYYRFLRGLEELADDYKYLLEHYSKRNIKVSKEYLDLLKKTNEYLKLFYKSFYKPKDETIEFLFNDIVKMYQEIAEYFQKGKENILIAFLLAINDKIRTLLSSIIELNIINE